MIIINNKLQVIYGETNFINIFGFNPIEIIQLIDFSNKTELFIDKITYKTNIYNIAAEPFKNDNLINWILTINKINTNLQSFNFIVDQELKINDWKVENTGIIDFNDMDSENYNGKCVDILNLQLFIELKSISIENINSNNIFIKELILDINDNDILCLIFYNNEEKTYKIYCRNITLLLNQKSFKLYEKNILSKKNFISHIFHEVRNYLNIITLAGDNLLFSINNNTNHIYKLTKIINDIQDSTNSIIDIINDVMTIEKFNLNNIKINPKEFMLNDLFNKCVYIMESNINHKKIKFTYYNNIGHINIIADYIKIKQVIINLLTNAVKFSNDHCEISFIIKEKLYNNNEEIQKYIYFEVIDNGVGISDKYKEIIFKQYEQIQPEILQVNTGIELGLSISKLIIELHNGKIGFSSIENKGTTFYFEIPLIQKNNDSTSEYLTQNTKQTESFSNDTTIIENFDTTKKRSPKILRTKYKFNINNHYILFVDDNIIIQKLMKNMFKNLNINNYIFASDGSEAVELYNKNIDKPFTIVFMDQEMPHMNGNFATKKILEIDPKAIIIGLTGNGLQEQINEFISFGVKKVYTKPVTKDIIKNILEENYRN